MNDDEKMDFWKALGRLYDETLALKEETQALRAVAVAHQNAAQNLQIACEALRETAVAHEKRFDHFEVVQQWLAEKERDRGQQGRH